MEHLANIMDKKNVPEISLMSTEATDLKINAGSDSIVINVPTKHKNIIIYIIKKELRAVDKERNS